MNQQKINQKLSEIDSDEALTTTIVSSAEFMAAQLSKAGVFNYLPANKGDIEQSISFAAVMKDCDVNEPFIKAVFELYQWYKAPLEDFSAATGGNLISNIINAIDDIAAPHIEFCACDEHGVEA